MPLGITRRLVVSAAVVGSLWAPTAEVVAQTVSPLIAPAHIHVESALGQGEVVQLPPLAITNQGDSLASVRMAVTAGDEEVGAPVDPSWISFSAETFSLEPSAGTAIDVWLEVPADAPPGAYHSRLRASFEDDGSGAGTAVAIQAAVATDLRFTVEERNVTTQDRIESWWSKYGIGAMLATGVGTVTFFFLHVANRFEIRRRGNG